MEMAGITIWQARNDIALAQGMQLWILWWAKPRGANGGVPCIRKGSGGKRQAFNKAVGRG